MHSHHSKSLLDVGNRPLYLALPSMGRAGLFSVLVLLTIFHFWLAGFLPPAEDELYYWTWAQQLRPSYFDHPPMTAYFIRFSTALFGNSLIALRLPAIVSSLVVFVGLLALAPRGGLVWALLFSPLALLGSVLITPDLPLVVFWLFYMVWFGGINATLDGWNHDPVTRVYQNSPVSWLQWIFGGVLLGFGGLSKYTMLLAVPCGLMALATRTRFRAWGPGYALHLAVAGLLVLPVFLFNWKYGFAPFAFQWTHSMSGAGLSLSHFFHFVGGQVLLVSALPFVLFPWICARWKDLCADARSQAYFWFFVLPCAFFLYKAFRGPLEANWAVVAYIGFFPVADRLLSWSSFKQIMSGLVFLCFLVPWAVSAFILIHLTNPFSWVEPRYDRVAVLRGQWETANTIYKDITAIPSAAVLYLPNYQWTSYFRYLGLPSEQIVPSRPSDFTLHSTQPCDAREVLSLETSNVPTPSLSCFTHRKLINAYAVFAHKKEVSVVWLARYSK